jgi:hypothetical protein
LFLIFPHFLNLLLIILSLLKDSIIGPRCINPNDPLGFGDIFNRVEQIFQNRQRGGFAGGTF